jgi:hypothetical protein
MIFIDDTHWDQNQSTPEIEISIEGVIDKCLFYIDFFNMLDLNFSYKTELVGEPVSKQKHQPVNIQLTFIACPITEWLVVIDLAVATDIEFSITCQHQSGPVDLLIIIVEQRLLR